MEKTATASDLMRKTLATLPASSSDEPPFDGEVIEAFDVLGTLGRRGFPPKFLRDDWKTPAFVEPHAPPAERAGFRDFRGLFLVGPTGRKKTASLCLLARDWLARVGRKGANAWGFASFPDLCFRLQAAWDDGGAAVRAVLDRYAEVPILVVDDVGAEKTTDFVLQSAYLLFNRREQAELPTYGTSNLTIEQVGAKLDERIASRIRGMCHVVAVGGEDQRGKR